MATTEDARAWARRIVEETLLEAGLVTPLEVSQDGPPAPPPLQVQASPSDPGVAASTNGSDADGSDAAARARRIVKEVLAAEAAEAARRSAGAERRAGELGSVAARDAELFGDRAVVEASPHDDAEPTAAPTAAVDLLPSEPPPPPPSEADAPEVLDEPPPEHHEPPLPGGPAVGGPPPPPLAVVDGWWQTIRERYRRRQAMSEWAPDATRPPRRTGRWLLVTLLALAALALLYPMAVDALRQLVAL